MDPQGLIVLEIIFGLTGLMLFVFAYLIGVKKKVNLIAGYKPEKVADNEGLGRFVGVIVVAFGLVVILYPWIYGPERTTPIRWMLYFAIPIMVLVVIMYAGMTRYMRKQGSGTDR